MPCALDHVAAQILIRWRRRRRSLRDRAAAVAVAVDLGTKVATTGDHMPLLLGMTWVGTCMHYILIASDVASRSRSRSRDRSRHSRGSRRGHLFPVSCSAHLVLARDVMLVCICVYVGPDRGRSRDRERRHRSASPVKPQAAPRPDPYQRPAKKEKPVIDRTGMFFDGYTCTSDMDAR